MSVLDDEKRVLKVSSWETPATSYLLSKLNSAEIRRGTYKRGYYNMEGVDGYLFFKVTKPIKVTTLHIHGEQWMVDDPLHWIGMQRLAEHSRGRVLVAGLGLGLIVHALSRTRAIMRVEVIELNPDVIAIVKPFLPKESYAIYNIIQDDIYNYAKKAMKYDTLILDIWRGVGTNHMYYEMMGTVDFFRKQNPNLKIYVWGTSILSLNPAVSPEVYKQVIALHKELIGSHE